MTQPHVDAGDLVVIGLVQEQHPERAQLYAQWQELDWPIMWDPFNTTGATAVPNAYLIDEHGVLQGKRLNEDTLAAFMAADFEAPEEKPWAAGSDRRLVQSQALSMGPDEGFYWGALNSMNWRASGIRPRRSGLGSGSRDPKRPIVDNAIYWANEYPGEEHRRAIDYFRLGVLYRMRHDSEHRQPGDFQHAIDAWEHALERDPNQYIWRRRIQQYGPMSDKPYPFYDWVVAARREIAERGETPVAIPQALTQAELGTGDSTWVSEGEPVNPDPDGRVTLDEGIVTLTSATTPDTQTPGSRRVLIEFTTTGAGHWNNEAEPLAVWIDTDALPEGWSVESPLLVHHMGDDPEAVAATSDEPRIIDFGLTHPADAAGTFTLTGYALYYVCEQGDLGRCLYRRQAFEVVVELE